jgi:transposase
VSVQKDVESNESLVRSVRGAGSRPDQGVTMWTDENRPKYNRDHLRYPSDLTDDEWVVIEPLIPPARRGGRRRTTDMRAVMNGVMYILSTGCQWRYMPADLPPYSTVFGYMSLWKRNGTLDRMHQALYLLCREKEGKEPEPTACVIDSQSVKSAEKGGDSIDPHGYDAGKLIKGKKRHILVDSMGLLIIAMVTSAGVQDRDGGLLLMATLFGMFPMLETMFADSGYSGPIFQTGLKNILPQLKVEIIRRSDKAKGFAVLPKRWIVERTIAWLNRCRRLAKDWENLNCNGLAFLKLASIRLMLRKLCNA